MTTCEAPSSSLGPACLTSIVCATVTSGTDRQTLDQTGISYSKPSQISRRGVAVAGLCPIMCSLTWVTSSRPVPLLLHQMALWIKIRIREKNPGFNKTDMHFCLCNVVAGKSTTTETALRGRHKEHCVCVMLCSRTCVMLCSRTCVVVPV
jgi:hypothetical protein